MNSLNPDFSASRVLIVGDVILDRYWFGTTRRISPEAPVPVVHINRSEERPGGAANVAVNVTALGGEAVLVGVTGDDDGADFLESTLRERTVECHFTRLPGVATVTKLRISSLNQQLIRLDFEDGFADLQSEELLAAFRQHLSGVGVVILSDYAKGAMPDPQAFIQCCRESGIPILIDPKGSDFTRYQGASYITPNLSELEAVVGSCPDEETLLDKGQALCQQLALDGLVVTRSEKGIALIRPQQPPLFLPARALFEMEHDHRGVLSEEELLALVVDARRQGKSVVMTNGCFDVLHPGHVRYLQRARAMGDRLLVAVNDDASVVRLKGANRPVNTLTDRMEMLAALESVDWVVAFSEDTPERLICRVLPDVLVKGGDYTVDEIAGADCVVKAGGDVSVLAFEDGYSTTTLLNRIIDSS